MGSYLLLFVVASFPTRTNCCPLSGCKSCVESRGGNACASRCGCASSTHFSRYSSCVLGGGGFACNERCCGASQPTQPPPQPTYKPRPTQPPYKPRPTQPPPVRPDPRPPQGSYNCVTEIDGLRGNCKDVRQCTGATFNNLCNGGYSNKCCVEDSNVARPSREWLSLTQFGSLFEYLGTSARARAFLPYFNEAIDKIGGTSEGDTVAMCYRIAAFVAQIGHESAGLQYMEEIASGAAYEGRTDLGNTQRGDGKRFKGRGPIQLTGRYNYNRASQATGLNLVNDPESVCLPSRGFRTTAWFWMDNNLNRWSTRSSSDFSQLTYRINGGYNGLSDRQRRWGNAKRILKCDSKSNNAQPNPIQPKPTQPAQIVQPSKTVQQIINERGCSTVPVGGLSRQLVQQINCIRPGLFATIREGNRLRLSEAVKVVPYLQSPAVDALQRAAAEGSQAMSISSALRTLPQQLMLYKWRNNGGTGGCGIPAAAYPGYSNHNGGAAVDLASPYSWVSVMARHGFRHFGDGDPVHFDFLGAQDVRALSVQAFQQLWNRNHPEDQIAVDSTYGPNTESRLLRSPSNGFAVGASCRSLLGDQDQIGVKRSGPMPDAGPAPTDHATTRLSVCTGFLRFLFYLLTTYVLIINQ